MKYSTYHAHTEFCDGRSTAREMILAAIERGCPEIGLSSHSPLPYESNWSMKKSDEDKYIEALGKLKKEYEKQIKVYKGLEFDTLSDRPSDRYDYVIGSAHHVCFEGGRYDVDHSAAITRRAILDGFGGDAYKYAECYFDEMARVYELSGCDIIGHFDLLLKFNEQDPIFDTEHPRYVKARDAALDRLLATPAVFEVNTGAIHRGYRTSPYPDGDVLARIKAAGRPIVVTSDSHSADTVDFLIDKTAAELTERGFRCIRSMDELLSITRK